MSKRVYADFTFEDHDSGRPLASGLVGALVHPPGLSVPEWPEKYVLHHRIGRLGTLCERMVALGGRYGVLAPRSPKREPRSHKVAHVIDPSGVLWHIAQDATP